MGITGSDANKRYTDDLYDAAKKTVIDASKESYSSSFFKSQPGNKLFTDVVELKLTGSKGDFPAIYPLADSPILGAAKFTDDLLSTWFEKVSYVGAFSANDNWLDGWTEFDPQNANY